MKLFKRFSWLLVFTLLCTMMPTYHINAKSNEEGIEIGTILYETDENGNVVERVVTAEGAISEEEAERQYYSRFIGNGIATINETTDTVEIITENTTWKDVTIDKDVYIAEGATLTIESNVIINRSVYVFGTLNNKGNLTVLGSLNCLIYGEQKVEGFTNGVLMNNENCVITCENIKVSKDYVDAGIPIVYHVISINADGKESLVKGYTGYNDAVLAFNQLIADPNNAGMNFAVKSQDTYWQIRYGIVKFKKITTNNTIKNINLTEDGNNTSGYMNPSYGIDAVYLETKNDKVKVRLSNVNAWVKASEVDIIPYSENAIYASYYKLADGKLTHYIRKNSVKKTDKDGGYDHVYVGPGPSGLESNKIYYSYDGTYFYRDYYKMIDDYRAGTSTNAVNKNNPYYSYYQYLSHRSKTVYNAEQINAYILDYVTKNIKNGQNSKMKETAQMFLDNQTLYGSNALLTIGVAANESGWGTSNYALNRNNLFGHAAYDSNPDNATGYTSVNESIKYHTQIYVSRNYCSPTIRENNKVVLGSTYFSPNLGDKGSGMNIRYASDPYWGEKNAQFAYNIDNKYGNKDYGRYTIGIKNTVDAVNVRKEPNATSAKLYETENILDVPFIILGEVKGQNVNGSDVWYKIQSDAPLKEDRSSYTTTNDTYRYDYVNSYAYIHSSYVNVIFRGNATIDYSKDPIPEEKPTSPVEKYDINAYLTKAGITLENGLITNVKHQTTITSVVDALSKIDATVKVEIDSNGHEVKDDYIGTDMILKINTPDQQTYAYTYVIKGDVNCDGKISSVDYVMIKNHILKTSLIQGTMTTSSDVNKDGKISSVDYVMIKNHILKITEIK